MMHGWLIWAGLAAGGCLIILVLVLVVWLKVTAISRHARRVLENISDRLLRDIAIPDGLGGWVVVDAVLLRDRHFYVLDLRDVEGAIFGAEKMDQWAVIGKHGRSQFQNPLRFMQDRLLALKALLPKVDMTGHVLFSARAHFPKGRPDNVQLLDEFAEPLRRPRKPAQAVKLDTEVESCWRTLCDSAESLSHPVKNSESRYPQ